MTPAKLRIIYLAAAAAVLVLGALAWPWLQVNLIAPLTLAFWAVARVFLTVHQQVYWTLLILLAAGLAVRLIPARGEDLQRRYHRHFEDRQPVDRLEYWRSVFRHTRSTREPLNDSLRKLLVAAVAGTERRSPVEVDGALKAGQLDVPARVSAFLTGEKGSQAGLAYGALRWTLRRLPPGLRRRVAPRFVDADEAAQETLAYLERYLENPYDQR